MSAVLRWECPPGTVVGVGDTYVKVQFHNHEQARAFAEFLQALDSAPDGDLVLVKNVPGVPS